jgi:hypothetical protein
MAPKSWAMSMMTLAPWRRATTIMSVNDGESESME